MDIIISILVALLVVLILLRYVMNKAENDVASNDPNKTYSGGTSGTTSTRKEPPKKQ